MRKITMAEVEQLKIKDFSENISVFYDVENDEFRFFDGNAKPLGNLVRIFNSGYTETGIKAHAEFLELLNEIIEENFTPVIAKVIINETHELLEEQETLLHEKFDEYVKINVPESGWALEQMIQMIRRELKGDAPIVFVSPIPALMKLASIHRRNFYVFHNDNREKKELPNGKIIMVVSKTGWKLV